MTKITSIGATITAVIWSTCLSLAQIIRACKRRIRAGVVYGAIILIVQNCWATQYFVATTGNDSNTGLSAAQAFLTIQKGANTAVNPGDSVTVGCGVYNEASFLNLAHAGVTIQASSKWCATIQAGTGVDPAVSINASTVTIKGFEIIGATAGTTTTGVKCNTGDACSVLNDDIHHIGTSAASCPLGAAIEPNNGNNQQIIGNLIYDVSPPRTAARCNHEQGIYSSTGTSSNGSGVIQDNLILLCYQCYAIQFDGGFPTNWTVSNNTADNVGQGAPNNSGGFLYFNCAGAGKTCSGMKFNNNIARNVGGDSCITEATVAPGGTMGANVYQNNLFSNCFGGNNFITGSLTASVNANPLFVSDTGDQTGNYQLQSGSPAIGAGTTNGACTVDFLGNACTAPITIGAYQFLTTIAPPNPPTNLTATVN